MSEQVATTSKKQSVSREFEPRVRFLGNLTIYFRDKTTVLVQQGSTTLAFHRWWTRPKGYFAKSWKPFCDALSRNRVIDLTEIRRLARKYDVELQAYHQPIGRLDGVKIINPRKRSGLEETAGVEAKTGVKDRESEENTMESEMDNGEKGAKIGANNGGVVGVKSK